MRQRRSAARRVCRDGVRGKSLPQGLVMRQRGGGTWLHLDKSERVLTLSCPPVQGSITWVSAFIICWQHYRFLLNLFQSRNGAN